MATSKVGEEIGGGSATKLNLRFWPKAATGLLDCREAAFDPNRPIALHRS